MISAIAYQKNGESYKLNLDEDSTIPEYFPDLASEDDIIDYDGQRKEKGEVFRITVSNDDIYEIKNCFSIPPDSLENNKIETEISSIKLIGLYNSESEVLAIKHILPASIMKNKFVLHFGGEVKIEELDKEILLSHRTDIQINIKSKEILFENENEGRFALLGITDSIDSLLKIREASDVQINNLTNFNFFTSQAANLAKQSGSRIKKKVYLLTELNLNLDDPLTQTAIYKTAKLAKKDALFDRSNNTINVNSKSDLSDAIDVMTGSYYENPINGVTMHSEETKILK
ncbi:MAG: hypothetical protein LBM13_04405 [Candidatus Ancillula sp.]|jgi:hypothetical protein|nr:hypothetical protein [Candidatus Ancillula sp.]